MFFSSLKLQTEQYIGKWRSIRPLFAESNDISTMSRILNLYQKILTKYPVSSQAVQTGILMSTGDAIAQVVVENKPVKQMDVVRTGQFFFVGSTIVGPPLRFWYMTLEKYYGKKGKWTAVKKVMADQLLFAPVFLSVIMFSVSLVQGQSVDEATSHLKKSYPDVLKTNYMFWPAVQIINFYAVPLQYQVVTVQILAIFWNTYLSWKMNVREKNKF